MDGVDLDYRVRTRAGCIPPELVSRLLNGVEDGADLNHRHTHMPIPVSRKAVRPAAHTAALADMRAHRLVANGGSTSTGYVLRHPMLKDWEAAADFQRPLSERGATARGADVADTTRPMSVSETVIAPLAVARTAAR
ncbi:hypothetical protein OG242_00225 [Streptomyces sp. NBC_00727]|uniref:hypothetical protein n=1 Tax=Streptomyces sp. NBC_00727 TaxID=2903675 RepID=UPI00386BCCA2